MVRIPRKKKKLWKTKDSLFKAHFNNDERLNNYRWFNHKKQVISKNLKSIGITVEQLKEIVK